MRLTPIKILEEFDAGRMRCLVRFLLLNFMFGVSIANVINYFEFPNYPLIIFPSSKTKTLQFGAPHFAFP